MLPEVEHTANIARVGNMACIVSLSTDVQHDTRHPHGRMRGRISHDGGVDAAQKPDLKSKADVARCGHGVQLVGGEQQDPELAPAPQGPKQVCRRGRER
jgi:hypothetical protein